MTILGSILKGGLNLSKRIKPKLITPHELQKKTLRQLMLKSKDTDFGHTFGFRLLLSRKNRLDQYQFYNNFCDAVPIYTYNTIFEKWWRRTLQGEANVTWPGKVKFFALSSGTSEASTKHIPLTKQMLRAIRNTGIKQMLSLSQFNFPKTLFEKRILMLGGSTNLSFNGTYYEGDLSGISASQIPFWFQHFYKPGKIIAKTKDWEEKLHEIAINAHKWDVGYIVGVPAWIQILIEKIIVHHGASNIHDIWPNLQVFCHGGVSFEPYKKGFEKLLGKPITYIETYLASEGFIAFQNRPNTHTMKMVLNNGIFYEFIPFNEDNFDAEGELKNNPETLMIDQAIEGVDYALLMSTCSGTWRYLIGDVIQFTDVDNHEIIIKGRTKHFMSLCGEHLSIDNMNKAIQLTASDFNIDIKEFTIAGIPHEGMFAHKWFIGTDQKVDADQLKTVLDQHLKLLNDDYRTERICALKEVLVTVLPSEVFYDWLKAKGKQGGQHKFPRVLKNKPLEDWEAFVGVHGNEYRVLSTG